MTSPHTLTHFCFRIAPETQGLFDALKADLAALAMDIATLTDEQRLLLQPVYERFIKVLDGLKLVRVEGSIDIETTGEQQ